MQLLTLCRFIMVFCVVFIIQKPTGIVHLQLCGENVMQNGKYNTEIILHVYKFLTHTFRAWEIWMKSKNLKPTAAYMYNASNTQLHLWLALCNVWLSGLLSYGMCSCNLIPSTSWQQNHSKNRRCTCLHVFYCSPYFIVGIIIQSVFRCVPSTVAQI